MVLPSSEAKWTNNRHQAPRQSIITVFVPPTTAVRNSDDEEDSGEDESDDWWATSEEAEETIARISTIFVTRPLIPLSPILPTRTRSHGTSFLSFVTPRPPSALATIDSNSASDTGTIIPNDSDNHRLSIAALAFAAATFVLVAAWLLLSRSRRQARRRKRSKSVDEMRQVVLSDEDAQSNASSDDLPAAHDGLLAGRSATEGDRPIPYHLPSIKRFSRLRTGLTPTNPESDHSATDRYTDTFSKAQTVGSPEGPLSPTHLSPISASTSGMNTRMKKTPSALILPFSPLRKPTITFRQPSSEGSPRPPMPGSPQSSDVAPRTPSTLPPASPNASTIPPPEDGEARRLTIGTFGRRGSSEENSPTLSSSYSHLAMSSEGKRQSSEGDRGSDVVVPPTDEFAETSDRQTTPSSVATLRPMDSSAV